MTRNDSFCTSLYRKPTFSGLYLNFKSFLPESYEKGLIQTLLHRAFVLCSGWETFHEEVTLLKNTFRKNQFPEHFIDRCTRSFLDRIFTEKKVIADDTPKTEVRICLPFLGKISLESRTKLKNFVKTSFPTVKLQVVFNSPNRLRNFFSFKDKIPLSARSHILYQFSCGTCNGTYIGKTERHYGVRVFEHLGISLLTHKNYTYNPNNSNNSGILNHINHKHTKCIGNEENFKIIGCAKTDYSLRIKEALLIHKCDPKINTDKGSVPIHLFE